MPSGPIPNVAGIHNFLYQNDQWAYIDVQVLRRGMLKPIDMSKMARSILTCRKFASQLKARFGLPAVHLWLFGTFCQF